MKNVKSFIIAALAVGLALIMGVGCGNGSNDAVPTAMPTEVVETEAPPATPTSEPTPSSTPTPAPTPTPTPEPQTFTCSDAWDNAGEKYTVYLHRQKVEDVRAEFCGTQAPVTTTCSEEYANAGTEFTFDPDETSRFTAVAEACGKRLSRGAWRTGNYRDQVDSSVTTEYAQLAGRWIGERDWLADDTPYLHIQCRSNEGLVVYINTGGYIGAAYRRGIPVEYSFDGESAQSEEWSELSSNEGVWLQAWRRGAFLSLLRANTETDMVVRVRDHNGAVYGTMRFPLTGIELQVEPVLKECGW